MSTSKRKPLKNQTLSDLLSQRLVKPLINDATRALRRGRYARKSLLRKIGQALGKPPQFSQ